MKAFFDHAAADYDSVFTNSAIGQLQRKRVYFWLNKINFFEKVRSVFELNCGTGYDAQLFYEKGLNVTATDISSQMIETAKNKRDKNIKFQTLDFKNLASEELAQRSVFSNFGGLNCASHEELENITAVIAEKQETGHKLAWVIMPKFSLMESIYLFAKLKWKTIFRRHTNKALLVNVEGIQVSTYFHSPKAVKKLLKPHYKIELVKPIALFLPPSYLEPLITKYPYFLKLLDRLETVFGRFSCFAGWSDHYIIIAKKR